jgi:antitoxin MazE
MRTRVQKWGNSLAVRIPKSFAEEAGLQENGPIDLSLVDGGVRIEVAGPEMTLDELLGGVTNDNLHGEVDHGPEAGNEAW